METVWGKSRGAQRPVNGSDDIRKAVPPYLARKPSSIADRLLRGCDAVESRWTEQDEAGEPGGGWFSYAALTGDAGAGEPLDEAYSRFTNPERFLPLYDWALEAVARLQREYEVVREEGEGMDSRLERVPLARPTVRLTPLRDDGAPITIAFTASPGLEVRAGRWFTDGFPTCHCDACDEQPEEEFERFTELLDDVVAGRFREAMRRQRGGDGWSSHELGSGERRRSGGSLVSRSEAARTLGGETEITVEWQPWRARADAASGP